MVSLVIYGLIAVALAASAGYAFLVLTNTSRQTTQLQENQVRMETAAAALRASVLSLNPANGYLYPPVGFAGAGYTQLPANLGTVGSSPWGQPYLYCPVMAQAAASGITAANPVAGGVITAGTVTSPSTATYTTSLYTSAATAGLSYVIAVGGANAPANTNGYLGFIVSNQGPGQAMPDCSAIVVTAAGATVAGGAVRGVTAIIPYTQRVVGSTDRLELYVGNALVGTGNLSGQDINNLMPTGAGGSIDAALNIWLALQPRLTEIYLTGGAVYSTTSQLDGEIGVPGTLAAQGQNSSLVIANDPASGVRSTLTFNQPLILTSNTTFQNLVITHANTGAPAITAYKSLIIRNSTDNTNGGGINLYNTSLTINSSTISNAAIVGSNSSIQFLNSNPALNPGGLAFPNTSIGGNQMRISFDDSTNYTFNEGASTVPALSITGGGLNISNGSTLATSTGGRAQGIVVSGGLLNVAGALAVTASEPIAPAPQTSGGIDLVDGASGIIQAPVRVTANGNGSLTSAIFVRGSSLGLNANVSAQGIQGAAGVNANNFINASIINAQEATITGSGSISTTNGSACIQILNQNIVNPGPSNIPIYTVTPIVGNMAGYANFNESQYGYPILLGLNVGYLNTSTNAPNIASQNAALLILTTNANNPYVSETATPTTGSFYVGGGSSLTPIPVPAQQQAFEAAVRTIINREYIQGLHFNFTGTCL